MSNVTKGLNYDSGKEKLGEVKSSLKEERQELTDFLKENKLKRNEDHSKDKKHGKKFKSFKTEIERMEKERDELQEFVKSNKPKKDRVYKYQYPKEIETGEDRKKFRSSMRLKAKRAKVTVDEYLADTEKYDKLAEKTKSEKKAKAPKKEKAEKKGKDEKSGKKKVKIVKKKKSED